VQKAELLDVSVAEKLMNVSPTGKKDPEEKPGGFETVVYVIKLDDRTSKAEMGKNTRAVGWPASVREVMVYVDVVFRQPLVK